MPKVPRISEAEWEVMDVVWNHAAVTARQVVDELAARKAWSDRTVKALLARLVKKAVLDYEIDGKRYLYRPRVSREACVRAEGRNVLDKVRGSVSPLLAYFLEEGELSDQELAELRRLLESRETA